LNAEPTSIGSDLELLAVARLVFNPRLELVLPMTGQDQTPCTEWNVWPLTSFSRTASFP